MVFFFQGLAPLWFGSPLGISYDSGPLVAGSPGPLVLWSPGPLVPCPLVPGPLVPWSWSVVLWSPGPLVSRSSGLWLRFLEG